MTSGLSWSDLLRQTLTRRPNDRVAVVGVGQELRGDDAAGLLVARRLRRLPCPSGWLIIEAGPALEAFVGPLRRFRPDHLVLIDAAFMGAPPGAVALLDWRTSDGLSASTHTLPLSLACQFLTQAAGCQITLIGIQVGDVGFGQRPTLQVMTAVRLVARSLVACIPAQPISNGSEERMPAQLTD